MPPPPSPTPAEGVEKGGGRGPISGSRPPFFAPFSRTPPGVTCDLAAPRWHPIFAVHPACVPPGCYLRRYGPSRGLLSEPGRPSVRPVPDRLSVAHSRGPECRSLSRRRCHPTAPSVPDSLARRVSACPGYSHSPSPPVPMTPRVLPAGGSATSASD